jgi:ferrous iron transport protein B
VLTIALAGNPNAGKSTLFNTLTGSRQHVGNWPGKTVEKKEGQLLVDGQEIILVDLPGTYSLNAYSLEEVIARNFIIEDHPDAVVCVVDSANLERNLYLVVQIMEIGVPVLLALNMQDVAQSRGIIIHKDRISEGLGGVPVIETIGSRDVGLDDLRRAIVRLSAASRRPNPLRVSLPDVVETQIAALRRLIEADPALSAYPSEWLALKLLENDPELLERIQHNPALVSAVEQAAAHVLEATGDDPDTLIADGRYQFINAVVRTAVQRPKQAVVTRSDQLDRVLTHRLWGVPIFLALMWLVFQITANVSAPFLDFTDGFINGTLARWFTAVLTALGLGNTWVKALLVDGILAGVGGVLVFVPVLLSLYLAIAILEDTGYMARAAFVMDRLMSRIGLHGKSFLPLLVGFGCTVPAIYATRTLENARDRKLTGFIATFMSCGARLPVYVLFGAAFFGAQGGTLVFAMYLLGIGMAVLTSLLFTKLVYRGKPVPPFVMELPPYRLPNLKTVWRSMTERTISFVKKAGTVIFAASLAVWLLLAVPARGDVGGFNQVSPADSLFGTVSRVIAPVFAPAGYNTWQASGALVTGFLAKEVIVSTMTQIYAVNAVAAQEEATTILVEDITAVGQSFAEAVILTAQEFVNIIPRTVNILPFARMPEADFLGQAGQEEDLTALEQALTQTFTPLSALAFTVFILLYVPCMSATAAMRHEFGTRWMLLQVGYTLAVAWGASVLVYQAGRLLGF